MTREELQEILQNTYLIDTIDGYALHGIPPGGFMKAVLINDLFGAMQRADYWNKNNLQTIVDVITHYLPREAYGNSENYHAWIADKNGCRSKFASAIKEKRIIDKLQNSHMNHIAKQFYR